MDESYLVVSDLHLGSEYCCNEEFEHFLDWLAACSRNDGRLPVQTQQGDRRLTPPTTFILLGDMVELWVPREHERSSVLCDSTSTFSKLIDLNCKKVYVLGNHDADLFEHECEKDVRPNDSFQTLMEWVCSNTPASSWFSDTIRTAPMIRSNNESALERKTTYFFTASNLIETLRRAAGLFGLFRLWQD